MLKGADLELLGEVRRIAKNVELLWTEEFDRPPIAVRVPQDMLRVAADIRAYNVLPQAQLEARGRAWVDVGFGSPESPLDLLRTLAADLDGIGFDPAGNRLLVTPDRLTSKDFEPDAEDEEELADLLLMTGVRIDEPLVAHLLVHVRERERSDGDLLEKTTDALLASMAWAEGEANLIAIRYLFRGMNLGNTVLDHGLDPGHVLDGRLLPAALERASGVERRLLDFVYLEGFARTVELFREGGWTAVERATQAHRTTSAVMHGGAEARSPVRFGPPETPAIPDLRLVDEDSLGEQGIVVLISLLTGKDNLGLMTGDGWTGDRLYRWETEDGSAGLTDWRTRWTDAEAASDFAYGFLRALRARFPESPPKVAEDGRQFVESGGRTFLVDLRGAEVRIRVAPTEWNATLESDVDASSDPALDAPRAVVYNSPPPPSSSRRERMEP